MGFCLYVAGGVFVQDQKSAHPNPQSASNLEFLLIAMKAIGKQHSITDHFTAQLEFDMAAAEVYLPHWRERHITPKIIAEIPNAPADGHHTSKSSPANGEELDYYQLGQRKASTFQGYSKNHRIETTPILGIMQHESPRITPAQQLDNHFGASMDNTSRFFITSQEPRPIPPSPPSPLREFSSAYNVNDIPQDRKRGPSVQDDSPQNTVDSGRIRNEDAAGHVTNGSRSRVPWIVPDQQNGTQNAAAFAALRTCTVPYGIRSSAFSQGPAPTAGLPTSQHQVPVSAPSPNGNLTQFPIREPAKRQDYEMWQTQEMDTYSMNGGWNIEMTDVAMQDSFQMGGFGDDSLGNGEGVAEFLNGVGMTDWNRGA